MALISTILQNFPNENHAVTSILLTLCFVLVIFWYTWMYRRSKKGSSPLPPGPRGLPLLGSLPFLDSELHTYFACLAQTYGPIFKLRLGKKIGIIVTSPSLAREVLKENDLIFANHDVPCVGRAATYGGRDITWTPYGSEWRMLRKVCVTKMLSNATLDSVYMLRRREIRETVRHIYSRVGSPVNVGEQMFLTALNIVFSMLWGGTIHGDERTKTGVELQRVVAEMTGLLGKPNLSDFYPGLERFDLQGLVKKMKGLMTKLDEIFDGMINQRLEVDTDIGKKTEVRAKDCKDFLQYLLQLKDEEDPKTPLTITHIKAIFMDMVLGGTDTTSNAVEFIMAELMKKPEVMKKLQNELDEVVGKDNIVEESHIQKLPYLQAVMKEALRLHPPLPLLIPYCPSETCIVGGYTIPKDAKIFVHVWTIHRDPSVWENPLEFIPERFLNSKSDYSGSDFDFVPFGSGRRICAGIAMAERMFMHSLATFVHSFDWKLPPGGKLDLSEKFGIVLRLKNPLVAIPTPRLSTPALYE